MQLLAHERCFEKMPKIEIRPAVEADIHLLVALDHNYSSDYAWQMEISRSETGLGEASQIQIGFREIRLPRSSRVEYPRSSQALTADWKQRDGLLVSLLEGEPVGYVSLIQGTAPLTAWVTDLVVKRRLRRQGIGSALLLSAQEWGLQRNCRNLVLEMQSKNYPAIKMAEKLGLDFCGYNDRFYANRDIALFFATSLR
jgi:ribosomal protein S18 acetylase RimI-like enzyme